MRILGNFCLTLISIFVSFCIFEVGLRFAGYSHWEGSSTRFKHLYPHKELGWHHKESYRGFFFLENKFSHTVEINRRGLREREIPYERTKKQKRVLYIGDSFVWGFGVPAEKRFSDLIQGSYPEIESVNAGVKGYSTDQQLIWFRQEGHKYKADAVILVLCGNDIEDNLKELNYGFYRKPRFTFQDGGLIQEPFQGQERVNPLHYWLSNHSVFYFQVNQRLARLRRGKKPESPQLQVKKGISLTLHLLEELRREVEASGAKFSLVTMRQWGNWSSKQYEEFLNKLSERQFHFFDVDQAGYDKTTMAILHDGHWNEKGHAFIAESVATSLNELGFQLS